MRAQMELQQLLNAIHNPVRITTLVKHVFNLLGDERGTRVLQFGLPNGERLDIVFDPEQVALLWPEEAEAVSDEQATSEAA